MAANTWIPIVIGIIIGVVFAVMAKSQERGLAASASFAALAVIALIAGGLVGRSFDTALNALLVAFGTAIAVGILIGANRTSDKEIQ